MPRKVDSAMARGTRAALEQAFNDPPHPPSPVDDAHLGVWAAEADFAALLAQLNDPPPQYRENKSE